MSKSDQEAYDRMASTMRSIRQAKENEASAERERLAAIDARREAEKRAGR